MPRFVRRALMSGTVATVASWVMAATAHAGFIDNHNETLVGAEPRPRPGHPPTA